jgi:hypothetical protein
MEQVLKTILMILDTMDQHEGSIALIGIAVTVLIFRKEVSNNYFTMERDNFNDIFKDLALKQLPEKIDCIDKASDIEWSDRFSELMNVLDEILDNAKYYKYSIPFFYECLRLRIDEIRDLERHDNWRLYRNAVKQNQLIENKCRAIIRDINNASKGRIFRINLYQSKIATKVRMFFAKNLSDHPVDRITETYISAEISNKFNISCKIENQEKIVEMGNLKKLPSQELIIRPSSTDVHIVDIKSIERGDNYFGYKCGMRWGKGIGSIVIKAKEDRQLKISTRQNISTVRLRDSNIHKIVTMWNAGSDSKHIYFGTMNIRTKDRK